MTLKALLVDDEPLALEVVEVFLLQIPGVEIVAKCESAVEAFQVLNNNAVDVIFLDIQMPALNGLDFIKALAHKPKIVIISAYRNFAVESYELDVVDYLLKPFTFSRLLKSIHKVSQLLPLAADENAPLYTETMEESKPAHICLKVDKKLVKVNLASILYIESLKDYIRVKTQHEDYITYCTLSNFTNQLPCENFIRAHRSYTLAIDKIEQIDGNFALIGGNYIPLSRNRKGKVMERFLHHKPDL